MRGCTPAQILSKRRGNSNRQCRVLGCTHDLSLCSKYAQKKHICPEHLKADANLLRDGGDTLWRFCQQCGKLEKLDKFQGAKRSCRESLNKRRSSNDRNVASHRQYGRRMCNSKPCSADSDAAGTRCSQPLLHGRSYCNVPVDATTAADQLAEAYCAFVADTVDEVPPELPINMSDIMTIPDMAHTGAAGCYAPCSAHGYTPCSCSVAAQTDTAHLATAAHHPCMATRSSLVNEHDNSMAIADGALSSTVADSENEEDTVAEIMELIENELRAAAASAAASKHKQGRLHNESLAGSIFAMPCSNTLDTAPPAAFLAATSNIMMPGMQGAGLANSNLFMSQLENAAIENTSARIAALSACLAGLQQDLQVLEWHKTQMLMQAVNNSHVQAIQLVAGSTQGSALQ